MECHDDEPAAGLEHLLGRGQAGGELGKLLVDEHAQRLERPGRRMDGAGTRMHDAGDDLGERVRGTDRRRAAGSDDGAGNGAGMALLAERRDDGGKVALGCRGHDIGRGRSVAAHAHVEGTIAAEGKSALGLVELHRGDAEVEDDAVDRVVSAALRHRLQIGESVLDQHQPAAGVLRQLGSARDRARGRGRCR